MTVLRVAAEQPQRVTHVITAGGFAESLLERRAAAHERLRKESELLSSDWPGYLDWFIGTIFSEPHSTKPYEDGVHYAWASSATWIECVPAGVAGQRRARAGRSRRVPDARDPRRRRPPRAPCERRRRSMPWCPVRRC